MSDQKEWRDDVMAGASCVSGEDLLGLFTRSGCTKVLQDGMEGDDLDWVWETCKDDEETRDFLSWISDPQHISYEMNILTDEELEKWEKLRKERPEAILSGQRLQDALQVLRQDEALMEEEKITEKSDEALSSILSENRELLDTQETKLEELNRLSLTLNTRKSKLALKVSHCEQKKENLDRELVHKQQTLLHMNVEHNGAAETLCEKIVNIQDKVGKMNIGEEKSEVAIPTMFFSQFDKDILLREDSELSKKISQYINSKFMQTNDNQSNDYEQRFVPKERSKDEYEKMLAEITRLQYHYQDARRQNIIQSAEVASVKSAKEELEKQRKRLTQGQIPMDKLSLQATVSELEAIVNNLEQELSNMVKDKLPVHLAEKASSYCQAIFKADLEAKIEQQKLTLSQMDMARDFLLEQASYQEVLGMLIEKDGNGLIELKRKLEQISTRQEQEIKLCEKAKNHGKNINDLKVRRSKKTLQLEDKFLITMHKLLTNTDIDPNMITEDDVLNLMSSFAEKMNNLDKRVVQTEVACEKKKHYIEGVIERVQKELQINCNNRCVLTPAQVSNKIKLVENRVREFETTVKKKIEEWQKLKREIKPNPFLATQKRLAGTDIIEKYGSVITK